MTVHWKEMECCLRLLEAKLSRILFCLINAHHGA